MSLLSSNLGFLVWAAPAHFPQAPLSLHLHAHPVPPGFKESFASLRTVLSKKKREEQPVLGPLEHGVNPNEICSAIMFSLMHFKGGGN